MNWLSSHSSVVIVGSGVSALYSALNLDRNIDITIVTNKSLRECNSYLAQGGISSCRNVDDIPKFIEDTLIAGSNKNSLDSLAVLANESFENINNLILYGVPFNRNDDNSLSYTREGAHSINRILFHDDCTGKAIMETLIDLIKARSNISIHENCELVDLMIKNNVCNGILYKKNNSYIKLFAQKIILATGGIGGLFKNSTNFSHINGTSLFLGLKHKIKLKDTEFIQFHPTSLYCNDENRRFLISESLRGEGAILKNINCETFANELLPRNILTQKILSELKKTKSNYVYLDIRHLGKKYLTGRFPSIYNKLLEKGLDLSKDLIPVCPCQHYFMGGIEVDLNSRSSCENLYVVGESSCTGVHGENRLASNSLLESLVFANRASKNINLTIKNSSITEFNYIPPSYIYNFTEISTNALKNYFSSKGDFIKNELAYNRSNYNKCAF